jgi:hypothetical protein
MVNDWTISGCVGYKKIRLPLILSLPFEKELFHVHYVGICGPDGHSRAPRDGFMASHIMNTK